MKLTHEQILAYEKDTLKEKLYDTLEVTKLSPGLTKFSRISEIIVLVIIGFILKDMIYSTLAIAAAIYAGYRLVKPKNEVKSIQEDLDEVVERIENYKDFKNSGEKTTKELKSIKKIDKSIGRFIPALLKVKKIGKICALIPVVNIEIDEFTLNYTGTLRSRTPLEKLLRVLRNFDSKITTTEKK